MARPGTSSGVREIENVDEASPPAAAAAVAKWVGEEAEQMPVGRVSFGEAAFTTAQLDAVVGKAGLKGVLLVVTRQTAATAAAGAGKAGGGGGGKPKELWSGPVTRPPAAAASGPVTVALTAELQNLRSKPLDADAQLVFTLRRKNLMGFGSDEDLATGTVSVRQLWDAGYAKPTEQQSFTFDMTGAAAGSTAAAVPVALSFTFWPPPTGELQLRFTDVSGLPRSAFATNVQLRVEHGDRTFSSPLAAPSGGSAVFGDFKCMLFIDSDNFVEPLSITLLAGDERHHQAVHDKYLVDVASQLQAAEPTPWSIPMQNGSVLSCNYSRAEAATLKLEVIAARRLRHAEVLCKDPYCVVEVLGCPEPQRFQSPVDEGAGSHPVWNYALTLNVLRSYQLRMSVYDQDVLTRDELIGDIALDLDNVFRDGAREAWVPLMGPDDSEDGPVGELHIRAELPEKTKAAAAAAAAAASARTSTTTHTTANAAAAAGAASAAASTRAGDASAESSDSEDYAQDEDDEFSNEEILEAFQALDLDHNGVVGPQELKHMLICMGELVTSDEIDEMIKLIDADGDGVCSFLEFMALAKHPNPTAARFDAKRLATRLEQRAAEGLIPLPPGHSVLGSGSPAKPKDVATGGAGIDDGAIALKAAETAEEKKRKLAACKAFCATHALRLPRLRQVFAKCLATTYFNRQEGFISQHELAELFDIKATAAEVVGIFKSYVLTDGEAERVGTINAREVLLALSAFVGATVEQRVRFVFELFDFDGSGTLEVDELTAIMRANHLAADPEAAVRKLQTILPAGKHADEELALDFDEFLGLANRFPNVIFPQFA